MTTKLKILLFVFHKKVAHRYLNYRQNAFYRNSYENPLNINFTLFGLTEIGKLFIKPFDFIFFVMTFGIFTVNVTLFLFKLTNNVLWVKQNTIK